MRSALIRIVTIVVLAWFAVPGVVAQKGDQLEEQLKAAIHKEVIDGDLTGAIDEYKQILATPGVSRAVAAKALFQMGRCYERLGNEEARKAYEKLVSGFADQKGISAEARSRLADLLQPRYPPTITLRRVWAGLEAESPSHPSQDGRYYTFGWENTDDIAIRDLLTGKVRRVTHEASDNPYQSGWGGLISRDNRQIAYGWYAPPEEIPELRLMAFDGSKQRTLVHGSSDMRDIWPQAWSSDGKQVLTSFVKKDLSQQFGFVSVADGSIRILKSLPPRTRASNISRMSSVRLSPDERHVVFDFLSNEDCKEHDILLMASDGSQEIPLVQHPADDKGPVWTPDGKHVVFASDRTGSWGFWALSVVDGKPEGLPQLIKADVGQVRETTGITRQGGCYYTVNVGRQDVYIASIDPGTGKWLGGAQPIAGRLMGSSTAPSWSPDGEYLAYLVQRRPEIMYQPGAFAVVIRSVRTGEEREVSTALNQAWIPVQWFPDGGSVLIAAWQGTHQDDDLSYYRVSVESGAANRVLRAGSGAGFPHLTPDGKTILYYQPRDDSPKGLALMAHQIDTGEAREIKRLPEDSSPIIAISPDSREVAFTGPAKDDARSTAIKVMAISGGEARELLRIGPSEDLSWEGSITYMPDGKSLLVVRSASKGSRMTQLWQVPIRGGEQRLIGEAMQQICFPSVHSDGRRIAFHSGLWKPRQLELWVMENFLSLLKP